jgi:hypothetical protein
MKKRIVLLWTLVCLFATASAEDTIKVRNPAKPGRSKFVSFQFADGLVTPTSRIADGKTLTPHVTALSLKYGFYARGDKWEDFDYGMPYGGIGLYKPFYSARKEMGKPFSLYLFQGAELKSFRAGRSLNYEINLGMSFNWNHFDALSNPGFEALGSAVNAHLAGNLYYRRPLSEHLDLNLGVNVTHFSNGAQRTPNYGINSISPLVELVYYIHGNGGGRGCGRDAHDGVKDLQPPLFEKRRAHDVSFFVTERTISLDTAGTNLRSEYPRRRFTVAGLSYSYMLHRVRRFMWGGGLDIVYDEGRRASVYAAGAAAENEVSVYRRLDGLPAPAKTPLYTEVVRLSRFPERISAGLLLKGEFVMPGYSIFAGVGYQVLHPRRKNSRLYQVYGIKVYLTENLFSSFGVSSNHITRSDYLYLNVGYTFFK